MCGRAGIADRDGREKVDGVVIVGVVRERTKGALNGVQGVLAFDRAERGDFGFSGGGVFRASEHLHRDYISIGLAGDDALSLAAGTSGQPLLSNALQERRGVDRGVTVHPDGNHLGPIIDGLAGGYPLGHGSVVVARLRTRLPSGGPGDDQVFGIQLRLG